MRAVFLDYATVSHRDDLDPSRLVRALPRLELRPQTAQSDVAAVIAGAGVVLVNKLRIGREAGACHRRRPLWAASDGRRVRRG